MSKISKLNPILPKKLTQWFLANQRDLPWRKNHDPYRIWVSEIMLQQTQVATVIAYFNRWMEVFPTVQELACADLDQVYKLWAGLGYYSRARNLHQGAKQMVKKMPANRDEWLEISGVGEYTAGAICSIAYNQPEAIVDGNVVRVLSRIHAIAKIDAKKTEIWNRARQWVSQKNNHCDPRDLNQALMELGATICKPKNPTCCQCPVKIHCLGQKKPEKYPPKKAKVIQKKLTEKKWIILHQQQVMLIQNQSQSAKKWRQGLWDFPEAGTFEIKDGNWVNDFTIKYVVTNHQIRRDHRVLKLITKIKHSQIKSSNLNSIHAKWFKLDDLPGIPAPTQKAIQILKK